MEQDHLVKVQEQAEEEDLVVAEEEWAEIALALAPPVIAFALNAEQKYPTLQVIPAIRCPARSAEQRWSGDKGYFLMQKPERDSEQEKRLKDNMANIHHKILIISGKGGVGKTTVAVNLAYSLALKGYQVGILDIDLHGPNIAKMLGIENKKLSATDSGRIEPFEVLPNLKAVTIALIIESPEKPIIWRGPLKGIAIRQFLADVNWGKLDYLIIDSPPGTGDEPLSVGQLIPGISGAIIVTTPQDVAILDSTKAVYFAKELKMPVIGLIENMSGLICPYCKKKIDLFKTGGGEKSAADLKVPFLGRIPIEPEMVKAGDSGKPFIHFNQDMETAKIIKEIEEKIINFLDGDHNHSL